MNECIEAHDRLANDYNSLLRDREVLRLSAQELSDAHDELLSDFEDLEREVRDLRDAQSDAETCLAFAETLASARLFAE